jgi:putative Ig domain-containing protein
MSDLPAVPVARGWRGLACIPALLMLATVATSAQDSKSTVSITTKDLPIATLWNRYTAQLQADGGIEPYHWRVVSGSLPRGLELQDSGQISGVVNQAGGLDMLIQATDRTGNRSQPKKFTLAVEPPLRADWLNKSRVNGTRIDGSVKVSNTTGRDFDLTFVVLAVNDIGRATAIGYQHFALKKNTRNQELPFGDTLSPGSYAVNVDLVGEEPVSQTIFRTRLVTPKETIAQSP